MFQDLKDLTDAAHEGNPAIVSFDTSCFDGVYVTGDVSEDYLNDLQRLRNDQAKSRVRSIELNEVNSYSYS